MTPYYYLCNSYFVDPSKNYYFNEITDSWEPSTFTGWQKEDFVVASSVSFYEFHVWLYIDLMNRAKSEFYKEVLDG